MNFSMIENLTYHIFMSMVLFAIPLMTVKTLPMFDKYLNPPPCVDLQVPAVIPPEPAVSTNTPSSTTIDQDAPSTRALLDPFQFPYPKRRLTMEEIMNKFIEERKPKHEKIDAFIREFRTTNELLLKERNNLLSELKFKIYGLSRAINKAQMVGCEAKGVTTRGGKSIAEPIGDNSNTKYQ
ncbi:hypothetical protein Tco_0821278 [Tanacetum coccineum]|uniref:Uncharacterized protein n=1 Tax=Tanacetum coccineum TaxID=301880 RepID=A0ABQ5ADJ8_9ASTR